MKIVVSPMPSGILFNAFVYFYLADFFEVGPKYKEKYILSLKAGEGEKNVLGINLVNSTGGVYFS